MSPHKMLYDRWFHQQTCPPPVQWSGKAINQRGQNAWIIEASVNGRTVAQSQHSQKEMAENDSKEFPLVECLSDQDYQAS
ncbi:hypothetical protein RhiXN_05769 [Rhizoctonia solani]|uniref:Uncharacterized protein n=1 Tax=Rhizoctonia solani TaxID=456999 RepID=A0A8H8NWP1_9AGAM|nr:uncharacterized protein RhiXN_05769 [Rhizoctonia solani]QRW20780.1 hypothetical protein RhiXN_05769 [Rhizoctonia solani]